MNKNWSQESRNGVKLAATTTRGLCIDLVPRGIRYMVYAKMQTTASSTASSLAKLFTLSPSKRKFPTMWKIAKIVPILKLSNRSRPSDYRPVSVLCIVSKLLEKLVHLLLWEHLLEHAPISDCQWGFQRGKSTTTTTLLYIHNP